MPSTKTSQSGTFISPYEGISPPPSLYLVTGQEHHFFVWIIRLLKSLDISWSRNHFTEWIHHICYNNHNSIFVLVIYICPPMTLSVVRVPWFDWHDRQIDRQTYRVSSFFSFLKMSLEMLVTLFLLILRTSRDVRLSKQFDSNDAKLLLFTTLKSKIYIEFFSKIIVLVLAKLIL